MYHYRIAISAATLLTLAVSSAVSASKTTLPNEDALRQDAESYILDHPVSMDEAATRLQLQAQAGDLEATLRDQLGDQFAGLWIEHEPEYRVVVRLSGNVQRADISEYFNSTQLEARTEILAADWSLTELRDQQVFVNRLTRQYGIKADSEIDVRDNRVKIYTANPEGLQLSFADNGIELPAGVVLVNTAHLATPEVLMGGSSISSCTAGFTVRRNTTNEQGISTAAHCPNGQSYSGTSLPFRSEDQQGNQDVQWNSTCGLLSISNTFNSGIGTRSVTGTTHRNNQAIGAYVCKFGRTTGRTCGYIDSKTYAPSYVTSAASTFVRVDGRGTDLSAGGDSGGPWFVETQAYGIHSGGFNGGTFDGNSLYMPINYISSLGVSVLTSNPGSCNTNNPPNASFIWTVLGPGTFYFNAGASSDSDGSIVSYRWDFGDGTVITRTTPTISHTYATSGSYGVRLTVTDDDGAIDIELALVGDCGSQVICIEPL